MGAVVAEVLVEMELARLLRLQGQQIPAVVVEVAEQAL